MACHRGTMPIASDKAFERCIEALPQRGVLLAEGEGSRGWRAALVSGNGDDC